MRFDDQAAVWAQSPYLWTCVNKKPRQLFVSGDNYKASCKTRAGDIIDVCNCLCTTLSVVDHVTDVVSLQGNG